ncbi:MAG: tRNA (adenosine(37)-N6)-dimethylallyltransferase MiaA [Bacteroidales bacterium]|nr:tRNA (adenosine(37)-N6)-dimethylallyltransferase MiaA [Bacteroidales bacterium]
MTRATGIIAVVGPTATGKTHRAVALATELSGEIISGDSRQVYRGMDLGTGKDLDEYGSVPYHLIDVAQAGDKYNLHRFLRDARNAEQEIRRRGNLPIICGGTGMYVEAFLNDLALPEVPENRELRQKLEGKPLDELTRILAGMKTLHNVTDVDTVKRAVRAIEIQTYYQEHPEEAASASPRQRKDAVIVGVDVPREVRRQRITARLKARLENGMLDEVCNLLDSGVTADDLIYYGLEYKFLTLHLTGELSFDDMFSQLEIAIHQFAKRQMTWFRGMERRGFTINWLPYDMPDDEFVSAVRELIKS